MSIRLLTFCIIIVSCPGLLLCADGGFKLESKTQPAPAASAAASVASVGARFEDRLKILGELQSAVQKAERKYTRFKMVRNVGEIPAVLSEWERMFGLYEEDVESMEKAFAGRPELQPFLREFNIAKEAIGPLLFGAAQARIDAALRASEDAQSNFNRLRTNPAALQSRGAASLGLLADSLNLYVHILDEVRAKFPERQSELERYIAQRVKLEQALAIGKRVHAEQESFQEETRLRKEVREVARSAEPSFEDTCFTQAANPAFF